MRKQKLSVNEKKTPDFVTAVTIISVMVAFSLFASCVAGKFKAISSDTAFSFVWGLFNTILLMLALVYYVFKRFRTYILSVLKKPPIPLSRGFLVYILFFPGLLVVTLASFTFFRILGFSPMPQQVMYLYLETDSFYMLFLLFFTSCIVAPFTEEIIFRGVIYPALRERFRAPAAILLSSTIFALMHSDIFVFAGLFAFGILLAYLFEKHENLWLPISVHFFNNLFANIAVLIVKYTHIIKTLEG